MFACFFCDGDILLIIVTFTIQYSSYIFPLILVSVEKAKELCKNHKHWKLNKSKMLKLVLLIIACNAISFEQWKSKYNKKYTTSELLRRKAIFMSNAKLVKSMKNSDFEVSLDGPFSAMTNEEYRRMLYPIKMSGNTVVDMRKMTLKADNKPINWVDLGKVTPVKNQDQCGSCYAFSAISVIESALLQQQTKYTNTTLDLSEQQLVDCVEGGEEGGEEGGCNGNNVHNIDEYLDEYYLMSEADYPYRGISGRCAYKSSLSICKVEKIETYPTNKNDDQVISLLRRQPLMSGIDASSASMQFYQRGIYTGHCDNKPRSLNHYIVIVGFGYENNMPIYLCKNSWGTSWGEKGYLKLPANQNKCGIALEVNAPIGVKAI